MIKEEEKTEESPDMLMTARDGAATQTQKSAAFQSDKSQMLLQSNQDSYATALDGLAIKTSPLNAG